MVAELLSGAHTGGALCNHDHIQYGRPDQEKGLQSVEHSGNLGLMQFTLVGSLLDTPDLRGELPGAKHSSRTTYHLTGFRCIDLFNRQCNRLTHVAMVEDRPAFDSGIGGAEDF